MEQKMPNEANGLTYQSSGKEFLKSVPPHKNPVKFNNIYNFQ
jgi:hypothetical protein